MVKCLHQPLLLFKFSKHYLEVVTGGQYRGLRETSPGKIRKNVCSQFEFNVEREKEKMKNALSKVFN